MSQLRSESGRVGGAVLAFIFYGIWSFQSHTKAYNKCGKVRIRIHKALKYLHANWPPVLRVQDALTQIQNLDLLHSIILVHPIKPICTTLTSTLLPMSSIGIISGFVILE